MAEVSSKNRGEVPPHQLGIMSNPTPRYGLPPPDIMPKGLANNGKDIFVFLSTVSCKFSA